MTADKTLPTLIDVKVTLAAAICTIATFSSTLMMLSAAAGIRA